MDYNARGNALSSSGMSGNSDDMNAKSNLVLDVLLATLVTGVLAGCDPAKEASNKPNSGTPPQTSATAPPVPSGPPAVSIADQVPPQAPPSAAERKDGAPIQGQVDPKEPAQRRDFETKKR